jgi:hypothetical protein
MESRAKNLIKTGFYCDLIKKKVRFRKGIFKNFRYELPPFFLSVLKGLAYQIGYLSN